jgi:hypothetical protein
VNLVGFLITILVLVVIVYVITLFIDWLVLPPPIRTIALLIVGLIALLVLLNQLGAVGAPMRVW